MNDWKFVENPRAFRVKVRKGAEFIAERVEGRQRVMITRAGVEYAHDGDYIVYDRVTETKMVFSEGQFHQLFKAT